MGASFFLFLHLWRWELVYMGASFFCFYICRRWELVAWVRVFLFLHLWRWELVAWGVGYNHCTKLPCEDKGEGSCSLFCRRWMTSARMRGDGLWVRKCWHQRRPRRVRSRCLHLRADSVKAVALHVMMCSALPIVMRGIKEGDGR